MDVVANFDRLMLSLRDVKSEMMRQELGESVAAFNDLFTDTLAKLERLSSGASDAPLESYSSTPAESSINSNVLVDKSVPRWWANQSWHSNPSGANKPNMREYIEAVTGRSVEDVSSDPNFDWQSFVSSASSLLYGVTSGHEDSRNWHSIMASSDIVAAARQATKEMHGATVAVHTEMNADGTVSQQVAVLKDRNGEILQLLDGDKEHVGDTIKNFGIDSGNLASQIESRVTSPQFDQRLLTVLRELDAESSDQPDLTNPS